MALLNFRNLKLAFGGPTLFDGVDLQLEMGDRFCLLGRNGSGKSTLMKMIMGDLKPDAGEVIRQQGLRVTLVSQDIPRDLSGTVFDVVAGGMGAAAELQAEYHRVSHELATSGSEHLIKELSVLQKRLEDEGGWGLHQEVEKVLSKLSLDADAEFSSLSGGTKRRVLLGRALISAPDILLLDEPTNHLDIETIVWLEEFVLKNVKTVLFITHDRTFARRLANRVGELDRGRLYSFSCSYDLFLERRESLLEAEKTRMALFDKKLAQEEVWVRQGIKARRTRNEGRVRALQKMREERRLRRERTGNVNLQIQEGERSGHVVAEAANASFSYDGKRIIDNVTTTIVRGDRVGIIGPNGAGKTTLLNLLLGKLVPQGGTVSTGSRLQVLYFDQLREQLDLQKSVMDNIGEGNDTVTINGKSRHVIGYLQDFLFTADRARTPVHILSGGERNRLLLAKLFTQPANVLVMDEPTNDLDVETLDLLEELLLDFTGTLLLVSHDRQFLNNVVTSTLVMVGKGEVKEFVGGYDDWLRQDQPAPVPAAPAATEVKPRRPSERPRKLSFKEERELAALPDSIAGLEAELEQLQQRLSDPEFYRTSGAEVSRVNTRLNEIDFSLQDLYRRWEELETIAS